MEFPVEEYRRRVERAVALMSERGLDALMVTGDFQASQNYRYFSGHLPRDYQANSARPHVFVLTREGGAAISVHFFSEGPARESWVDHVHVYTQPFRHADAMQLFRVLGISGGRVGVELGLDQRMRMPVGDYELLKTDLPGVEWVDAAPLIWDMRAIKSPAEIQVIREADRINANALAKTWERAEIGMSERQVYDICAHALIEEGSNLPPFAQMTIQSSARHRGKGMVTFFSGPTDEPLREGDVIFIDSGATVRGYWGEFNRMAVMGEPSTEQRRWHGTVCEIIRETIDRVVRPNITCAQAMSECIGLYEKAGLGRSQYEPYVDFPYLHLGHGLGLESSEVPLIRLTDDTVIRPGMVFSIEAYVKGPDMQYGSEDDVVVTDTGTDLLSSGDPGLYEIG